MPGPLPCRHLARKHQLYGSGDKEMAHVDMLIDVDTLSRELPGLHFDLLQEVEREIVEGTFHTGMAAVVQAVAHKH